MRPADGFRNLVRRLKQVVLPAPFGPIKACMLPRRTLSATSRTAKNPANSLVNPWVSRMNSSAKQISPISHRRDASRARPFLPRRQVLRGRLGTVPARRLRAGICRQREGLGKVESWADRRSDKGMNAPLVELFERLERTLRRWV